MDSINEKNWATEFNQWNPKDCDKLNSKLIKIEKRIWMAELDFQRQDSDLEGLRTELEAKLDNIKGNSDLEQDPKIKGKLDNMEWLYWKLAMELKTARAKIELQKQRKFGLLVVIRLLKEQDEMLTSTEPILPLLHSVPEPISVQSATSQIEPSPTKVQRSSSLTGKYYIN